MNYKEFSSDDDEDNFNSVESSFNQTTEEDNSIEAEKSKYKSRSLVAEVTDKLAKLSGFSPENLGEVVDEGHIQGGPVSGKVDSMPETAQERADREAREAAAAAALQNRNNAVDFDAEDKNDGDKAQDQARQIKIEFSPNDVKFWFAQLEDEMLMASIGSQWLKKSVLQRNLPIKQKEDVKGYLTLTRTEAGQHIYLDIKRELIRIYAPKPSDSYRKALTRTMVGLPSQLGYQIVDDVCRKPQKLVGCCCAGAALAIWTLQLPVNVRAHISNRTFDSTTYKQVFEEADQVFQASKQVTVAAVGVALDETLPAFSEQNQPQVAAVAGPGRGGRGGGNNRGNRGGRGGKNKGNRGGGQSQGQNQSRGPKHSSVPDSQADKMCDRHYRHADAAWYCLAPSTCPWANRVTPKN